MRFILLTVGAIALIGCRQDMHDQPRYRLNSASDFWSDGRAARPAVKGTVARGMLKTDAGLYTGKINGRDVLEFPFPITKEVLARGKDRFAIYCTPCHGLTGHGDGMIVTRGLKNPPSYHSEALREAAPGHIFDVITNGSGSMMSYGARIPVKDRWAIVAYIRVLQQSQNVKLAQLTTEEVEKVKASERPAAPEKKAAKKGGSH
ncbi:MAG: cytochrome c [Candidatus Solibacter usitatus]|nr:cytochrome c [Candidatus Solibacter usitatus]